jgi:hypothetical protein
MNERNWRDWVGPETRALQERKLEKLLDRLTAKDGRVTKIETWCTDRYDRLRVETPLRVADYFWYFYGWHLAKNVKWKGWSFPRIRANLVQVKREVTMKISDLKRHEAYLRRHPESEL